MYTDFKIVVRTYKRSDLILDMTLGELKKQKDIDLSEQLYLVVANEEEKEAYEESLEDFPYRKFLISGVGGNIATKKACEYFPWGEKIVFLDDDIQDMQIWKNIKDQDSLQDMENFGEIMDYMFRLIEEDSRGDMFGVSLGTNWYWKKRSPFAEFKPKTVGGQWWGGLNHPEFITPQGHSSDNIRSARTIERTNGAYFVNWTTAKDDWGLLEGGLQESGDRGGEGEDTLQATWDASMKALSYPVVKRYFKNEPVLIEKANCYTLRIKPWQKIKKLVPRYQKLSWEEYLENPAKHRESIEETAETMEELLFS